MKGEIMSNTPPSDTVKRLPRVLRDERVYLENVRGLTSAECPSRMHGAQAAVMRAIGEEITYDELVGAGALAFRLQIHPTFCPSSPHARCGYECVEGSLAALPWHVEEHAVGDLEPDNPSHADRIRAIRRTVMDSIDRGIPVQYGDIEDGIIVGYQSEGSEWTCYHPLRNDGADSYIEKGLTWHVLIYTARKDPLPTRRPVAEAALRQAAAMWHAEYSPDADRKDRMGRAGWAYWVETLPSIPEKQQGAGPSRHGSAMIYHTLVGHRRSAAAYLRLIACEFPDVAAMHLRQAAELYDQVANRALSDPEHSADTIAPYWAPWPEAVRAEQLRRMRLAAELDGRAIAKIEAALALPESIEHREQA